MKKGVIDKINKIMEKEKRITAPEGCEIEKVEIVDGAAVITFKEKERKLPKSWEGFCEMFPITSNEKRILGNSTITYAVGCQRDRSNDKNLLPDRATAEAILALCQLVQLRNAYNGDWVPDWNDYEQAKYVILFNEDELRAIDTTSCESWLLTFKTKELREEFLRNFRPLVENLKPLYGIKEGGDE